MGEKCSSSCPTRDHDSFGACLRAKGVKVAYCNSAGGMDYTAQKNWDRNLADYKDARAEGIQPGQTTPKAIEDARRASDATGTAFKAG